MSSFSSELQNFKQNHPEVRYLDLIFTDINATPRGKRIPLESADKLSKGLYLPVSTNTLSVQGGVVESAGLGEVLGEPDNLCFPVPGSLAPTPNEDIAQVMLTMMDASGNAPCPYEIRNVLKGLVEQLHTENKYPVIALELEFYLLDKKRDSKGMIQPPINPVHSAREAFCDVYTLDNLDDYAAFLSDINYFAQQQGLLTSGALAESAPGQFEINFSHQKDVLKACDQIIYLKRLIRQVARKHNYDVTFMAKPYADEAGSGEHIHLSILDGEGNNIFSDPKGDPSDFFHQTIASLLSMMPESMALLCPNVNSYRRFCAGMYTPSKADWNCNHRAVALRIPESDSNNRRIEHRIAGADVNPYLLTAIVLSGVRHAHTMSRQQCPPPLSEKAMPLPMQMKDALRTLENGEILKQYLTDEFINIFIACKQSELSEFETTVTPLEIDWMLHSA